MAFDGYFIISRRIVRHWLYPLQEKRRFTRFEAWVWCIGSAYYFCTKINVLSGFVTVPRGSFTCTADGLARTWLWDRRTVEKFLRLLESDGMITRTKIDPKNKKSCTLLKINNYNEFQPDISGLCTSECRSECALECTLNKKEKNIKKINGGGFLKKTLLPSVPLDFD